MMNNFRKKFFMIIFLFLLSILLMFYFFYDHGRAKEILEIHGWIEGVEVIISSEVSGKMSIIKISEGDKLKRGHLIAVADSEQIKAKLEHADTRILSAQKELNRKEDIIRILERDLEGARLKLDFYQKQSEAKIKESESALDVALAGLEREKSNGVISEKNYNRFSILYREGIISSQKLDDSMTVYEMARADLQRAEDEVARARASLELAHSSRLEVEIYRKEIETIQARVVAAKSEMEAAKADLASAGAQRKEMLATYEDTYIRSPTAGTVMEKLVEEGEWVAVGTPLAVLLDTATLEVRAYLPEPVMGRVQLGDEAEVRVDPFPQRSFKAVVTLIGSQAEFTPKEVQTEENRPKLVYKVKLKIQDSKRILKPGMPATVQLKRRFG